jgi:hypothetical protein
LSTEGRAITREQPLPDEVELARHLHQLDVEVGQLRVRFGFLEGDLEKALSRLAITRADVVLVFTVVKRVDELLPQVLKALERRARPWWRFWGRG